MNKLLLIWIMLFSTHLSVFAGEVKNRSICEKLQNNWTVTAVYLLRFFMDDQELLCRLAEAGDVQKMQYCKNHNIGNFEQTNSEDHTAASIAILLEKQEILEIINSPKSPVSVVDRKFIVNNNHKFKKE